MSKDVGSEKRPPLGPVPRYIWNNRRIQNLMDAVARFHEAGRTPDQEWVAELEELLRTNAALGFREHWPE